MLRFWEINRFGHRGFTLQDAFPASGGEEPGGICPVPTAAPTGDNLCPLPASGCSAPARPMEKKVSGVPPAAPQGHGASRYRRASLPDIPRLTACHTNTESHPAPHPQEKTRNKQLLGTRKPLAGVSTCAAQGMVWLFAPQRKLQLRRLAHKAGNCKSLLLPGAGGVPRVPESGRALQGPWARGKAAGLRFRETGTQGQGKNRGEERESAEQREHRDAWGGRAGTKGWGGPRHPLPLQVGRAGWKPKGSSLASPGWR